MERRYAAPCKPRNRIRTDTILVQAAVSALVLLAFASFVIDYGILSVSRNQAQNATDRPGAAAGGARSRLCSSRSVPAVRRCSINSVAVVAQTEVFRV